MDFYASFDQSLDVNPTLSHTSFDHVGDLQPFLRPKRKVLIKL